MAQSDDAGQAQGHERGIAGELWQVLGRHRLRIGVALALLLVAKVATVAVPLLLKRIIDVFQGAGPAQPAAQVAAQLGAQLPAQLPILLLAGYAALRFSSTLFNELRDLLFSRVTLDAVSSYAQRTFSHLHALGPRFHARRSLGSLLPDIDRGTGGIAFLLGVALFTIVPTLVEIGLVLVIMLEGYPAGFAVIILLTFLAYAGFTLVFTARRVVYQRRVNKLDSSAKGRLADSLINYDTVKTFTNEALEARRFAAIMDDWRAAGAGNQRALFTLHVGQSAVIAVGVAAIMLLAGQEVLVRRMSTGDLVLVNAYALQVCLPLNALGFVYREARDAWVNAERLFALLRERPETVDPPGAPPLRAGPGEVVFDRVGFAYEAGRPILAGVDLRIAPGTTLAVVGRSGSGKSTLARLLLRYYEPGSGRILVDGQDIAQAQAASVRAAIGVVPQETALFNDTIGNNIAYGRPGCSRDQVIAACRAAQLHDTIAALPDGYETQVGERGAKLSGGERQRIAIARTILKNPRILIFDEATSALDAVSEHAITEELGRLSRERTTLVVAHRLSTIVEAHRIVVMDRGRIIEQGTHAELLRQNGAYARLWSLQQRIAQDGA